MGQDSDKVTFVSLMGAAPALGMVARLVEQAVGALEPLDRSQGPLVALARSLHGTADADAEDRRDLPTRRAN